MITARKITRRRERQKGTSLIEFSLVAFQLVLVLFAVFELSRMVLVSTTVAHSARTAIRYAIVHGATRTGTGVDGASGPSDYSQVVANIKKYASGGLLNTARLTTTVSYPDGSNTPGSRVSITVIYPYDPFTLLPLHVNLGSTSQGIIYF